jgi:hypothetical protein
VNESLLRELVPEVIGVLVRRGADFAAAEDAVQDALVEAEPMSGYVRGCGRRLSMSLGVIRSLCRPGMSVRFDVAQ